MTAADPPSPPLPDGLELVARDGERAGLAEVLRVRRTADGAELTLTLLTAEVSAETRFRDYVLAVMERLSHIDHPGIVKVLGRGVTGGRGWVLSAAPAGQTVRAMLDDGTLDPARAVELFEPLARALRTATEYGLQHRDLDPGNVLITTDERAILLEPAFVDALAIPGIRDARPDVLIATPPERLRLAPPDARSDVHLLGGLLLTALTARPPGSEADAILRDRERDGAVPAELDLVLWRALAADPLQRPASPRDFFHQVRRALSGEGPERFIRQPQPSVSGTPAASTDLVRRGPGAATGRRPRRQRRRRASGVTAWPASAGRAMRRAGGGITGLFGRMRPATRRGYAETERPAPARGGAARPAGELEAPRDDADPHPAPSAPAVTANGGGAPAPESEPAARIGAAAERLRRATPPATGAPVATVPAPVAPAPAPAPEPEEDAPPAEDPAAERRAERARKRRTLLVGGAAVAALAAGTATVLLLDDEPATQQAPAARETVQGPVALTHPPQWQTVDPAPPVLGIDLQDPVALEPRGSAGFVPGSATLVAGTLPATGADLLPPGLAETLEQAPEGEPVRVGDLEGYRYRGLAQADTGGTVDLYVFGTAQGTLAVSCFTGTEVNPDYRRQCETIAGSLQARGVEPVALDAAAAYSAAMQRTMSELNEGRSTLRRRLASAQTQTGQARAADRLASVYRRAGGRLVNTDAPAAVAATHEAILRQVRLTANSYERMAAAARADNDEAFIRARAQVRRREARLDELLRQLRAAGYEVR